MTSQPRTHHSARMITIEGQTRSIADWARLYKRPPSSISTRIAAGWDPVHAVMVPPGAYSRMSLKEKQRYAIQRARGKMDAKGKL